MKSLKIGSAEIRLASCLEVEMPIDAVAVVDPPYNIGKPQLVTEIRKGKNRKQGRDFGEAFDSASIQPKQWAPRMPNTVVSFYSAKKMAVLIRAFQRNGFEVVQDFHWIKKTAPMPMRAVGFAWAVESGYVFRRKGTKHPVNKEAGWSPNWFLEHTPLIGDLTGTHCTQKPIQVMKWLIRFLTRPETLVVDPFMGSGTTGVAAIMLGRKFLGIESNEEYFEMAAKRLHNANATYQGSFKVK